MLKCLSKDVQPSDHIEIIESHCEKLRAVYRDCIKPSAKGIEFQSLDKSADTTTTSEGVLVSAGHRRRNSYLARPALKQKLNSSYDSRNTLSYRMALAGQI